MIWPLMALSALFKFCVCRQVEGSVLHHGYNPTGGDIYGNPIVLISGHIASPRIIPIAGGSYQSHVPFHTLNHGPVYNVQYAPVAVHPMPVAQVVGNYHVEGPVRPAYQEPVAVHHVEPVIHPDDVHEYVEEEEGQSAARHGRNIALNIDMVPIELSVPMLSLSTREPVRKQPKRKLRNHDEFDSKRNPRFFGGGNFDINVDIKDVQFNQQINTFSSVDTNLPSQFRQIESGLGSVFPKLPKILRKKEQIESGLSALLPKFSKLRRKNHSGLSSLPKSSKLRRKNYSHLSSLPKSSKLRRKNHSGLRSLPKSSKLRRKNHSDLSSLPKSSRLRRKNHSDLRSLPKSSKLRRKNHSGLRSLPKSSKLRRKNYSGLSSLRKSSRLRRKNHSGLSSLPKSSKLRRKNHSDLSGLRHVPHEWVNKDEKRYGRQSLPLLITN